MLTDIKDKLRNHLLLEHWSEPNVIYFLVEVRKVLELQFRELKEAKKDQELDTLKLQYRALIFHCDWAVHPVLDRTGALEILKEFDEAHPQLKTKNIHELEGDLSRKMDERVGMRTFRDQLKHFLSANDLETKVVGKDWATFMHHYAGVIDDCPLTIQSDKGQLRNISKVIVNKETAREPIKFGEQEWAVFRIQWVVYDKNGETGVVNTFWTDP